MQDLADPFWVLGLEAPGPSFNISPADVTRQFRRLSLTVHPDKNPNPDAILAFQALVEAHAILVDPEKCRSQAKYT